MTQGPADLTFTLAYLAVLPIAGYAAVAAVVRPGERHWAEVGGLSIAAGAGLTAAALFIASLLGFPPSRGVLAAWAAVVATGAAGVLVARRGRLVTPTTPGPGRRRPDLARAVGVLAAAAVLAALANVWASATAPGLGEIDEYAIWMLKAKVVALSPLRPVPAALTAPGLSYSHQDYPLLLPLLAAGAYAAVGRVDESAAKLVLPPLYLAMVGLVYAAVRRDNRRAVAVAATAVAVAAPVVVDKAGLAVGELPVTLFFAATVSMLARWVQRHERADLLLAGGFAAAAAFSKNEGLAMLPAFAVVAVAYAATRRDRRLVGDALLAIGVSLMLLSPWLVYRHYLPRSHEDYGGKFLSPAVLAAGLARLPHVLAGLVGHMVDFDDVGGVWVVLAAVAVVGRRAFGTAVGRAVWAVLLAQLGLYVAAFLVTPWDVDVLLPMVTSKLLGQAVPAAAVLIGLHAAAAMSGRNDAPADAPPDTALPARR